VRHALVGRLVADRLDPVWRADAHHRAVDELRHRDAPAPAVAHHLERVPALPGSAGPDDVAVLRRAAEEVLGTAPPDAVRWLRRALEQAAGPVRREVAFDLAGALAAAGRLTECRDLLHDTLLALPADPTVRRTDVVALCGRVERMLGHYAEAGALLHRELTRIGWVDDADAGDLAVEYGLAAMLSGTVTAATELLDQAAEHLTEPGDRATMLATQAFGQVSDGQIDAAGRTAQACAALVDGLTDTELAYRTGALTGLGLAEVFLERFGDADRHLRRGEYLARRAGLDLALPYLLVARAQLGHWSGRLDEATGAAREAYWIGDRMGLRDLQCFSLAAEAEAAAWREPADLQPAIALARRAVDLAVDAGDGYGHRVASLSLAHVLLHSGDGESCAQLILDTGRGPDLPTVQSNLRPVFYWMLCWADLLNGNLPAARQWADHAADNADRLGLVGARSFATMAASYVALASGAAPRAVTLAREAATGFGRVGMTLARAAALVSAARGAAAMGDGQLTASLGTQARELAGRCGAARIATMLDARAVPVRSTAVTAGVAAATLTAREQEIARLTATGASTQAIGRTLRISPRTVEAHLSRIYRKLNVPSRAALVAVITRDALG
jgi:DNA-binding CsgD family transcriptional regulator